ncbi:cytochrome P450 [Aspergillus caelatus]|uniref:Cytochrome P450 n=1 Tax=Aspergillus caelatus TaxID=61420 RepID=A0A5N6ZK56_9EURO|nr:cytochrome P450 [Aspergillus caelatus]KAE8357189.1 cytochrome P450 [Aspergillus caelatus]
MILLLCISFLAVAYLLSLIVYRIYFHPLSKIPGPLLPKLTDWYAAWMVWRGTSHTAIWKGHQKYGNVGRCGPNSVSVCSQTGLMEIYSTKANVCKIDSYVVMSVSSHAPNTFSCIDKKTHAFKRRILFQAFTDNALIGVQDHILSHIGDFCAMLNPPSDRAGPSLDWGPSVDIAPLCDYLAFDVISDLSYGRSFGMLKSDRYRYIPQLTKTLARRNATCMSQPKLWRYKLDRLFFAGFISALRDFGRWIRHQGKERARLGNSSPQKDCFHYLLNALDPKTGQGFTERELWNESLLLVVAGSDSVATSLSAVLFNLAHSQQALQKATTEIRSCFEQEEDIRLGSQLRSCSYLHACISESLRISPAASNMAPRRVLQGGITVDGYYIPEGTIIGTPIYALHHNEEYYPRPFKYEPERWLEDQTNDDNSLTNDGLKRARAAFCPFSIGPRSCLAKNLAWAELTLTLARVLFSYDIRLPPDHCEVEPDCCSSVPRDQSPEYKLRTWIVSAREGPSLQFRPRSI